MDSVAVGGPCLAAFTGSISSVGRLSRPKYHQRNPKLGLSCSSSRQSEMIETTTSGGGGGGGGDSKAVYKPGPVDDVLLNLFRNKMVEEVGWDSVKPGYDGLIEVANRLMMTSSSNSQTKEATVRILRSLFPPFLLELYRILVTPIQQGKLAAEMVARVTVLSCQWLMGRCEVNSVDLPDGSSWTSGVLVERCKYLEESKCVGICINTCKLPTQTFFKDCMGIPLLMEPNFNDYSCQFKFGVLPPAAEDDSALKEPCLEICPTASRRSSKEKQLQCPKAA